MCNRETLFVQLTLQVSLATYWLHTKRLRSAICGLSLYTGVQLREWRRILVERDMAVDRCFLRTRAPGPGRLPN
jgi:hypothetical protein